MAVAALALLVPHRLSSLGGLPAARTILAVVAGFILWSVLWVGAGQGIPALLPDSFGEDGTTGSAGVLALFLIISVVVSYVSGFVTAKIDPGAAMKAVKILAGLLLVVGAIVEIAGWGLAPAWYHIVFLALLVPVTLAGGKAGASVSGA